MNQSANDRMANERKKWEERSRALETARQRLANEGVFYPLWNTNINYSDFYQKIRDYSAKESAYMLEALREHGDKNPLEEGFQKPNWNPYKEQ